MMYPKRTAAKVVIFPVMGKHCAQKTTKMCTNLRKCVNKIPHFGKKPTDFLAKTRDLRLYSNGAPSPVGLYGSTIWLDYMSGYMSDYMGDYMGGYMGGYWSSL